MNQRITRFAPAKAIALVACAAIAIAACPLTTPAQAQADPELKPIAVVAFSGYDALVEDVNFIGSLMGNPQLAQMFEPMVMGFTQGLDKTRPLGAIILSDGIRINGGICIPVTDLNQLVTNLQGLGITSEDDGDGNLKINVNGMELYIRETGDWAIIAMQPMQFEGVPEDPGKLFATLTEDYDIGIRAYVQNIPQAYREMLVQELQKGMAQGLQQLPEESAEAYEARKKVTTAQIDQLKRLISELDEFTFGLALDGEEQRAYLDIVYTAVAGSTLAEQLAQNSDPKTNFSGFFQPDAAMMLTFASKVIDSDIAQMDQMFGALRQQIHTVIDEETELPTDEARDTLKGAVDDFMDAFMATVRTGTMDGGAVLNMSPESLTFVAGGFSGDPSKVESGLKKLAELAKGDSQFPGVEWNSSTHADISFHTLNVPILETKVEPRQLFGEQLDIVVGIGKDSVYFALGRDALEAAKGIIDASASDQGKTVPPMEMTFSLGQIMSVVAAFADGPQKPMMEMVSGMLQGEATARDHIRIVVQPIENGARTRIEAEEGVLRTIIMMAQMAQGGPPQ